MNIPSQQRGMSVPGILAVVAMIGFFVMCAIRLVPHYIEYLSVREIVSGIASEYNREVDSISDIRRRLESTFNTNQIYDLKARDIEVFHKDGHTYIDARYEARVPIIGPIDAVIKFDDLEMEAGPSGF